MPFEHAAQIGTRESSWTGHEVGSRSALTTDGSESLATDTSGIV